MNPNNRGPNIPPPPHPEFGDPFTVEPGMQRTLPPGAALREGVVVRRMRRGGKDWISMRPV